MGCEQSHLFFTRYFFRVRQSIKFRVNWHHHYIADTIEGVMDGSIENVVINVSPGSSKTEMVCVNFIARGLAVNPRARFLYLSYADDLVLFNSGQAQEIIQSEEYQGLWTMESATDVKAKKRWNITINNKTAGGVYAVSLGGQITGFRAGHMAEGFQGALLVDDPLKIEDGFSKVKRDRANRQLVATVESRKANPKTPIVVIMQRVAEEDPTGFIKSGGLSGKWTFVNIPAIIDDEYVSKLPKKYQDMIASGMIDDKGEKMVDTSKRDDLGRFSYWEYKEPIASLVEREAGGGGDGSIGRYAFASQYMQNPSPLGGGIIKGADFKRYKVLPILKWRRIYADTAQKTGERNDYSVFECWGLGVDNNIYLIDIIRGKWEAPELKRRAIAFWSKHKAVEGEEDAKKAADASYSPVMGRLQKMMVEDKASGTGLIQDIRNEGKIPVSAIQRSVDKLTRVMDGVPYIESGRVYVPEDAPFVSDFITENEAFTPDDSHANDDQIDPMLDAIQDNLARPSGSGIMEYMKELAAKANGG